MSNHKAGAIRHNTQTKKMILRSKSENKALAKRVKRLKDKNPDLSFLEIAKKIGISGSYAYKLYYKLEAGWFDDAKTLNEMETREMVENKIQTVIIIESKIGHKNDLMKFPLAVDPLLKGDARDKFIATKILEDIIDWREQK